MLAFLEYRSILAKLGILDMNPASTVMHTSMALEQQIGAILCGFRTILTAYVINFFVSHFNLYSGFFCRKMEALDRGYWVRIFAVLSAILSGWLTINCSSIPYQKVILQAK
jgi:hypothetical protein